ncbi:MAG TPA: penicillin-binding protein 2 [Actinomycetota bacterium]
MNRPPAGRLVALLAVMVFAFGAIFVRLAVLQVSQAAELEQRAVDQRLETVTLPAERGQILDRVGRPLALSTPAVDVYADPRYVADPWTTASRLGPILGLGVTELVGELSRDTTFVYLARAVELDVAERIRELGLPGIGFLDTTKRSYPAGPLAPQVLGFVGTDGVGLWGLEQGYEEALAGTPGVRTTEFDPHGQPIVGGVHVEQAPVPGSSIVTTLDRELQFHVEQALAAAVQTQRARGGIVIVMEPNTGEILAMATAPGFDPNAFDASPPATYRNRALTDAFEPGSTNKVITAAAAVQEGVMPLDERISVRWTMEIGPYTIHDAHPHGTLRMTLGDIIAHSSNIGAVHVANRLGRERMATYLSRFGLGRSTGIGFPGESRGIMLPLANWSDASLATISYGQGIASTPLQMISVFSTIANDGRWVQPRLVRGTVDPAGMFHEAETLPSRRVVSADTARTVTQMLAYAVDYGTGTNAQVAGFQVAGKTGTARIPHPDRPGYLPGEYMASFIGYLPAGGPKVVIAAILDRPASVYGGLAAAPLFRQVAGVAITQLGLVPAERVPLPPHALPLG